jgi:hypothetical protein
VDSITGLIRVRPSRKPSQSGYYASAGPTQFFSDNRIESDRDKGFWEKADKMNISSVNQGTKRELIFHHATEHSDNLNAG